MDTGYRIRVFGDVSFLIAFRKQHLSGVVGLGDAPSDEPRQLVQVTVTGATRPHTGLVDAGITSTDRPVIGDDRFGVVAIHVHVGAPILAASVRIHIHAALGDGDGNRRDGEEGEKGESACHRITLEVKLDAGTDVARIGLHGGIPFEFEP